MKMKRKKVNKNWLTFRYVSQGKCCLSYLLKKNGRCLHHLLLLYGKYWGQETGGTRQNRTSYLNKKREGSCEREGPYSEGGSNQEHILREGCMLWNQLWQPRRQARVEARTWQGRYLRGFCLTRILKYSFEVLQEDERDVVHYQF